MQPEEFCLRLLTWVADVPNKSLHADLLRLTVAVVGMPVALRPRTYGELRDRFPVSGLLDLMEECGFAAVDVTYNLTWKV